MVDDNGNILFGDKSIIENKKYLSKSVRHPVIEFKKKIFKEIENLKGKHNFNSAIATADSQKLPLSDNSVDLIFTSPPYASNSIDYMRAHKFSLVWLGYNIDELKDKRNEYIVTESTKGFEFEKLPAFTLSKIQEIAGANKSKTKKVERYFSEMSRSIKECLEFSK